MPLQVFAELKGGLGNQMFQYAAGRALSLRLGAELVLRRAWFDKFDPAARPREYDIGAFPVAGRFATTDEQDMLRAVRRRAEHGEPPVDGGVVRVQEPYYHYWPGFTRLETSVHLLGWWQSHHYFAAVEGTIRADFAFPPLATAAAREVAARIATARMPVAVHVRRGDYLDGNIAVRFHNICTPGYYGKAIDLLAGRFGPLQLFVFSDDADWVRGNFDPAGHEMEVVDIPEHRTRPWHDLHLMALTRHQIIANSTFSWWGAWLADRPGKVVIGPPRWMNDFPGETDYATIDRYPPGWIKLGAAAAG